MKSILIVASLLLSLSSMGAVCSKTTEVCADYTPSATFTTKQEGRFELSLQGQAELVSVDLWMQMGSHGHGSSPLKVTQVAPQEYDITKAFFVMKGLWQIRVTYKQGDVTETLIIPVNIQD